jgi:hypothetical protein
MTEAELTNLISLAASQSFSAGRGEVGSDEIIGYSILSHDTADSCCAVIATKKGQKKRTDIAAADFIYLPVEWDVYIPPNDHFELVNTEIQRLYEAGDYEIDESWHEKFRELIFNACVGGLEKLILENFFGREAQRNELFITFSLSDSATSKSHLPDWVKRLNTQIVFEKYMGWHQRWYRDA